MEKGWRERGVGGREGARECGRSGRGVRGWKGCEQVEGGAHYVTHTHYVTPTHTHTTCSFPSSLSPPYLPVLPHRQRLERDMKPFNDRRFVRTVVTLLLRRRLLRRGASEPSGHRRFDLCLWASCKERENREQKEWSEVEGSGGKQKLQLLRLGGGGNHSVCLGGGVSCGQGEAA